MDRCHAGIAAGILVMAVMSVSCKGGKSIFDKNTTYDIPVKVMTAGESESTGVRSYVGTAAAEKSAVLSCRYPGRVVKLDVRKGEYVKAGDVLAEVESQNVLSTWTMSHSSLEQARDGYDRARKVHRSGSMADVKMVEVETKLAQAEAAVKAADAALEDCRIKAPFSGVVQEVLVSEGMELNPLEGILSLLDISSVEIDFPVPESELADIGKGDTARVSVPALDVEDMPAVITSKGVFASPLSHTYECTAVPVRKIPGLMPGMVVKVRIDTGNGPGIVIPASVIRTDVDGRYVWTVSDEGIVSKKHVVPGGFSGKGVIIAEGLSAGDKVITEGVQKVCTGMKVMISE